MPPTRTQGSRAAAHFGFEVRPSLTWLRPETRFKLLPLLSQIARAGTASGIALRLQHTACRALYMLGSRASVVRIVSWQTRMVAVALMVRDLVSFALLAGAKARPPPSSKLPFERSSLGLLRPRPVSRRRGSC